MEKIRKSFYIKLNSEEKKLFVTTNKSRYNFCDPNFFVSKLWSRAQESTNVLRMFPDEGSLSSIKPIQKFVLYIFLCKSLSLLNNMSQIYSIVNYFVELLEGCLNPLILFVHFEQKESILENLLRNQHIKLHGI